MSPLPACQRPANLTSARKPARDPETGYSQPFPSDCSARAAVAAPGRGAAAPPGGAEAVGQGSLARARGDLHPRVERAPHARHGVRALARPRHGAPAILDL